MERRLWYYKYHRTVKMRKDDKYWIWLSRIEKINILQKNALLKEFKTPYNIWNAERKQLTQIPELDEKSVNEIFNNRYRKDLEKYENYIKENRISIINIYDEKYPQQLKKIYDSPIMLYTMGNTNLLKSQGIAIVGCRECSDYGKNVAQKIAYEFSKRNICIISGLAKGIDKYAHIGALEAGGQTIAVIGSGLDYTYPFENKKIYERIVNENGLIITEYVIGTRPNKINFPARNRIISGLSKSVIVVEAKEKSGSLITADFALEQGKDVFAVPGNIYSPNSKGTNELIKDGAAVFTNCKDVINIM